MHAHIRHFNGRFPVNLCFSWLPTYYAFPTVCAFSQETAKIFVSVLTRYHKFLIGCLLFLIPLISVVIHCFCSTQSASFLRSTWPSHPTFHQLTGKTATHRGMDNNRRKAKRTGFWVEPHGRRCCRRCRNWADVQSPRNCYHWSRWRSALASTQVEP